MNKFGICITTIFHLAVAGTAIPEAPVAFILESHGEVQASKSKKEFRRALVLEYLYKGDQLKTGPKGQAVIIFTNGGKKDTLQENSIASVDKTGLTVQQGKTVRSETAMPLPAVSALSNMSNWVKDNNSFAGIVLRSQDDADTRHLQTVEKQLREVCGKPTAQASDLLTWAAILVELRDFTRAITALDRAAAKSPLPSVHTALAVLHNHLANDLRATDPNQAAQHEAKFLENMKKAVRLMTE